ncbi:hypothetical protein AAEO56_11000 [Flavobacterium sp. DGU11]|uniref:Uncharacterized protein n=1 Tax=Flavobacterium arundinis TaxID=3139143 RepID=A0ABU9HX90_9FLAO
MDYKISIPKPCHEDWTSMTPNEQGRFCGQCSKTVTDFTGMKALEIQSFLLENSGRKVCGRFKASQLDSIVITIPERVLFTQTRFRNVFLLALLVTMGTTLFSCNNGQTIGEVKVEKDTVIHDSVKLTQSFNASKTMFDTITMEANFSSPELTGFAVMEPPTTMGAVAMDPLTDSLPPPPEKKLDNEIHMNGLVEIDTIP